MSPYDNFFLCAKAIHLVKMIKASKMKQWISFTGLFATEAGFVIFRVAGRGALIRQLSLGSTVSICCAISCLFHNYNFRFIKHYHKHTDTVNSIHFCPKASPNTSSIIISRAEDIMCPLHCYIRLQGKNMFYWFKLDQGAVQHVNMAIALSHFTLPFPSSWFSNYRSDIEFWWVTHNHLFLCLQRSSNEITLISNEISEQQRGTEA